MVSLFRFHIRKIVENSKKEEKSINEAKENMWKLPLTISNRSDGKDKITLRCVGKKNPDGLKIGICAFYLLSTGTTISFCPG